MISNPFNDYYVNQAGSGIAGYSGVRFQKGYGFFGRLLSTIGLPILKYLGKRALKTGVGVGSDLLSGENIKDSVKKRLKATGFDIVDDAVEKLKPFRQAGTGYRRRRKKVNKKKRKRKGNKKRSGKRKLSLRQVRALAKGRKSLKRRRRKQKEDLLF